MLELGRQCCKATRTGMQGRTLPAYSAWPAAAKPAKNSDKPQAKKETAPAIAYEFLIMPPSAYLHAWEPKQGQEQRSTRRPETLQAAMQAAVHVSMLCCPR